MYKGYLKGSGKHAATKFKKGESELLSLEEAQELHEYVGLLEDGIVMVDCDNYKQSQKLIEIFQAKDIKCSILETNHGHHFYFDGSNLTTNKIKWYTSLGIMCDYKLGTRNTPDPLKIDGVERTWLVEYDSLDALPKWLYPMTRKTNQIGELAEGDGRNQSLFNYILTLQSEGMSKDEIRETIRIINEFILAEPVTDEELNVILRDEAFMKESFFIKGNFQHHKFSHFLISEHHIITLNGVLHIYHDGVYSDNQLDVERAIIKHLPQLNKAKRGEVMSYLQAIAKEGKMAPVQNVAVANGILNIETWELEDFSPDIVVKNKIPINYVKGAYSEVTDRTLNKIACQNKDLRKVMDELFGYILLRRNELGKTFILTGNGSNGKSTFLKLLRRFVGKESTSSLDLKDLNKQFKNAMLFGKLANIGDDIAKTPIRDSSEFKKLTTGEAITVERKGHDPFDFENYAKLIFSANETPIIEDNSDGLLRRLMLIPFNAKFSPQDDDFDPFIVDKLMTSESLEYMLQTAVEALKRLLKNNRFSHSKLVESELNKYKIYNSPILGFLDDINPKLDNEPTSEIFAQYNIWCHENDHVASSKIVFSKDICRIKGMKTKNTKVNKKQVKVFVTDKNEY
ncbi:DNA primase family protein [Listeria booriae]|uniref:DNA primase family protein n=1 Tax=Listeria booriae TaxID=1552123 RepID=UPI0016285BE3|nr:DNA primase family protein [Listeria booriae]MBC2196295.1 DNA primase [Listeria booriae]